MLWTFSCKRGIFKSTAQEVLYHPKPTNTRNKPNHTLYGFLGSPFEGIRFSNLFCCLVKDLGNKRLDLNRSDVI
eukprot:6384634-Amphidinium_carterae.1